jgi:colicin import membrane protein
MHLRNWLALGLIFSQTWASAQTADAPSSLSLDQARQQRVRAQALKDSAENTFAAEKAVCKSKAIAINCLSSARERRAVAVREANALESEGRKVEREARNREIEAKAAKRAAEAPALEAKERADAEGYRDREARRAVERKRKQAEEATKLETRRAEVAAKRAAQEKRLEARRVEDARRAARAPELAKRRAEREKEHAERVRKIDERKRNYADLLKKREVEAAAKKAAESDSVSAK